MHAHRRDQAGVVHLYADNGMNDDEPTPLSVRLFGIGQERKALLDQLRTPISLRDAQPISVLRRRPRANVPEFRQVLRTKAKRGSRSCSL